MNTNELEILSKQFDEAMDLIGKYELEVRQQQTEIEALKLHIQGLQASINLGEKYMARKNPVGTLEEIGKILRKAQEK